MAYMISVEQIMRAVPTAYRARVTEFVATFNQYADTFGINTTARVVHFLAQVTWESGYFKVVEENLNYSAKGLLNTFKGRFTEATAAQYARKPEKIANKVYANRYGNGNEASGDGWRYRGRGLMQLTFKANYKAYQDSGFCNGNLVAHPEWLAKAPGHTKSAMWYFRSKGCNAVADRDDGGAVGESVCKEVTHLVNGGYNNMADRLYLYRRYKKEFGLK